MKDKVVRLEHMDEEGLRAFRGEAFEELSVLIESDDLLRVIDLIDEDDSRYQLVEFLSQLTTEQQETLKNLFKAQLITGTHHEKMAPYKGRLELHSQETHLVGDDGELYHTQSLSFTGEPISRVVRVDLMPVYIKASQEETAESLAAKEAALTAERNVGSIDITDNSHEELVATSIDVLPVELENDNEDLDDLVIDLRTETQRTKSQQRFFDAGVSYLDTQVIGKIVENNLYEGMSRHALQQFFSFMQVRKFVSAKENGQIKASKEDGVSFDDLFILALCGNKQLKSKMDVNSFKVVIDDLRTYFFEAIAQEMASRESLS
jgi:hypothetical protein